MQPNTNIIPLTDKARQISAEINAEAKPSKTYADLADEAFIPQGLEIPKPELVFGLDGVPVFTKKSISTLKGKAKAGKTTCTAWVTANIIKEAINVLWIDTEQGTYYASRTQHWVLSIAQLTGSEYLKFYDLKIHGPRERMEIVSLLIERHRPDFVIIDGIRDLVFDINSPEEATITTNKLMRWADIYDCHILSILHENKGSDHARGHLGTEMVNKSETVIKVSSEKGITVCEPEFTRGEPFSIFAFDRDAAGMPNMVDYKPKTSSGESNTKKVLPIDIPEKEHYMYLVQAFGTDKKLAYSELCLAVSAAFELYGLEMGITRTKSFVAFYSQNGYLRKLDKESNKTYYEILIKKPNIDVEPF